MLKKKTKKKPQKKPMLTVSSLRERGWTRTMVDAILGEPDELGVNPIYKSAAPMRLYLESRIKRKERTKAFAIAHEKAKKRSDAAIARADERNKETEKRASAQKFHIRKMSCEELLKKAIESYNDAQSERQFFRENYDWDWTPADESSSKSFLKRIQVNYIRHHLTNYEQIMHNYSRRPGGWRTVSKLRKRCYGLICETYPFLQSECRRQQSDREETQDCFEASRDSGRHLGSALTPKK